MPQLTAIIATCQNGIIGNAGKLPWRLKNDLARFKRLTMGGTLIMGRKTFESIGSPLLGRSVIVVTRNGGIGINAGVASSPDEAIQIASDIGRPIFICGGAEIYKALLPKCDRLLWTNVIGHCEGDTRFDVPQDEFEPVPTTVEGVPSSDRDSHASMFAEWVRIKPSESRS